MSFKSLTTALLCVLTLSHCEKQEIASTLEQREIALIKQSFSEPHLATTVQLVLYTEDDKTAEKLAKRCFQQVRDFNAIFSSYESNSELSQLSGQPINTAHKVSGHLFTVIEHAQSVSNRTNGAFDITLGDFTKHWQSPQPSKQDVSFRDLVLDTRHHTITLTKPLKLDLGGIAKGYIADQLMLTLQQAGVKHCAVIIGGETVLADAPPNKPGWKIGIENPEQQITGFLTLSNTALSTSGDSYQHLEQNGQRRSHLIDPATKTSKANRLNVTTIAPTAMQADAWATAMRILPTEQALNLTNRESEISCLFIPHQEEAIASDSFPAIEAR